MLAIINQEQDYKHLGYIIECQKEDSLGMVTGFMEDIQWYLVTEDNWDRVNFNLDSWLDYMVVVLMGMVSFHSWLVINQDMIIIRWEEDIVLEEDIILREDTVLEEGIVLEEDTVLEEDIILGESIILKEVIIQEEVIILEGAKDCCMIKGMY